MHGTLSRSPFAGEVFAAEECPLTLLVDQDYCLVSGWMGNRSLPLFVSCRQNYRILENLVATAFRVLDGVTNVFVGFWKRSRHQMPEILMDPRVLTLYGPAKQVARLIEDGQSEMLIIRNGLGTTGRELYDNSILLELYTSQYERHNLEMLVRESILHDCLTVDWMYSRDAIGANRRPTLTSDRRSKVTPRLR